MLCWVCQADGEVPLYCPILFAGRLGLRKNRPTNHNQKEGFLITVEYEEESSSSLQQLEQGESTHNKWRKKFRFHTAEQIASAVTPLEEDGEEHTMTTRTMQLCYPQGQPQAALPVMSVQKGAEFFCGSDDNTQTTSKTRQLLKDAAFTLLMPFYFMYLFSGFNGEQLMTARFWVLVVLWAAASLLVVLVLFFVCGLSPFQLHQKLVCKSAERVRDGAETWEEDAHNNNESFSLTAPLLSAVTGF